jgi:hypothetical protein
MSSVFDKPCSLNYLATRESLGEEALHASSLLLRFRNTSVSAQPAIADRGAIHSDRFLIHEVDLVLVVLGTAAQKEIHEYTSALHMVHIFTNASYLVLFVSSCQYTSDRLEVFVKRVSVAIVV